MEISTDVILQIIRKEELHYTTFYFTLSVHEGPEKNKNWHHWFLRKLLLIILNIKSEILHDWQVLL